MEARSERLGHNTPDLQSVERDSKISNRKEHEGQRPGVLRGSEIAPECTSGGDQKLRGKSWCSDYIRVRVDCYQATKEAGLTEPSDVPHL